MMETTPTRLMMILNEDRDGRRHTSPYTTIIDRSRALMNYKYKYISFAHFTGFLERAVGGDLLPLPTPYKLLDWTLWSS